MTDTAASIPSQVSSPSTAKAAARSMAPVINMAAALGARRVMMKGYQSATGKPPPLVHSPRSSLLSKVLWGAALGAVIALVEGTIWRLLDEE